MIQRYENAQKLLTAHTRELVLNGHPVIHWDGETGSYLRQKREEANGEIIEETVIFDARSGEEKEILTFIKEKKSENAAEKEKENKEKENKEKECAAAENENTWKKGQTISPDGQWRLENREHNLWIIGSDGTQRCLTEDGEENCEYGTYLDIYSQVTQKVAGMASRPLALFSPDSRWFITYRADLRRVGTLPVIESCGGDGEHLRPIVHEYACPFAPDGDDRMPCTELYLGDAVHGTLQKLDIPPYVMPVFMTSEKSFARWFEDSSGFYCTWYDRSCTEGRLYLVNVTDGKAILRVQEKAKTFHNLGAFNLLDGFGSYQFSNFITADRKYAFWQSERSGFAHLYRYDEEGNFQGDLFGDEHSTLIVQKLIRLDEHAGKLYFMANHIPECSDPLYYSLYCINLDGANLMRLTPEDGNHQISMGTYSFADTWSRVDQPPVTNLRSLDGSLIRELEKADVSALMETGYIVPERITVMTDDGQTELYGILVKPADFDPAAKYPVVEYVYGGAQLYNVPRDFTWDNAQNREILGGLEEFAQLGFAGIILDGRGTPGRGKVFHDFSYKNIHGCAGLDDHPGAIRRLGEKYPFLDLDRVGIWGNSGGGYATVSALFKYGDLYKVGVASSGNYDQRVYENSWTERYYGAYDPEVYQHGDITAMAQNLTGKLLLACGCMDDNVTIWQTFRLCDELTRHNKDYDLMVLPRINHNVPSDLYFVRRKMDYFVQNLLGEEPPKEFKFDCM